MNESSTSVGDGSARPADAKTAEITSLGHDDVSKTRIAPEGHEQRVLETSMLTRDLAPAGFSIERELGRGGMGVVFLARQAGLNRPVALKMILADGLDNKNPIRFLAEAEAIASVKHPQVVEVYQFGEVAGRAYLALEYCPGGSLDDVLKKGLQTPAVAAELMAQVADGVQAAHEQGIVHRDLKPHNVLFTADGTPKVTDFGLAKKTGGPDITKTNAIMGTPAYMSPEQAQGGTKFVGPPADVWSLGVMLYELLTGTRPFEGEGTWDVLSAVMSGEFIAPRKRVAGVPRDLELICLKCLRSDPRDRYATAGELADDLRRFARGEPVSVRPPGSVERLAKWSRKNKPLAAALAAVAATLLIGTAVSVWQAVRARNAEIAEGQRADEARKQMYRADEESKKVSAQMMETRRFLDFSRLREAHALYRTNLVEAARDTLGEIAPSNRDTVWGLLKRVCEGSLYTGYGHSSVIYSVAWSPDGSKLATGSQDETVRIWDAATGQCTHRFRAHEEAVWCVAWSPDGTKLATASADKTMKTWDAANWKVLNTFTGHSDFVLNATWSPDGAKLATASQDKTARIWNAATGKQLHELKDHNALVWCVSWSPDGTRLVSGGNDFSVRLWNVENGKQLRELKNHKSTVRALHWSPDGTKIASGSIDNHVRVWDLANPDLNFSLRGHGNGVWGVAWSPDGRRIASASEDKTIRLWNVESGMHIKLQGHESGNECVAWSPDGRRVASVGWDQTLRVWDAESGLTAAEFKGHSHAVLAAVWLDDSRFASAGKDKSIRIWDAATGMFLRDYTGHAAEVGALARHPLLNQLASAGVDKTVRVWNLDDHSHQVSKLPDSVYCVAWSQGGALACGGEDKIIRIFNTTSMDAFMEFKGHTEGILSIAISPLHRLTGADIKADCLIASAGNDQVIRLWKATGEISRELHGHTSWIAGLAWSPDGSRLASAGAHRLLKIWNPDTGELVRDLKGHTHIVNCVAWSPDGARLASGSADGTIRIWDAATGNCLVELPSGDTPVNAVAWSPDGKSILGACSDHTLKLWEPHRGPKMKLLRGHVEPVKEVRTSADGTQVVSEDRKGSKMVWDAKSGEHIINAAIPDLAPKEKEPDTGFDYLPLSWINDILMVEKAVPPEELTRRRSQMAADPLWHRQQGKQCDTEEDWFAAAFHWGQVFKRHPDDNEAKARLGAARSKLADRKSPTPRK